MIEQLFNLPNIYFQRDLSITVILHRDGGHFHFSDRKTMIFLTLIDQRWNSKNWSRGLNPPLPGLN